MPDRTPAVASAALRRRAMASSWPSSTRANDASGFFSRLFTSPLARSGWAGSGWSWIPRSSMNALIVLTVGWRSPWTTKMPLLSGGTTSVDGGGAKSGVETVVVVVVTGAGADECFDACADFDGAGAAAGVVTVTVTVGAGAGIGAAGVCITACGAGADGGRDVSGVGSVMIGAVYGALVIVRGMYSPRSSSRFSTPRSLSVR